MDYSHFDLMEDLDEVYEGTDNLTVRGIIKQMGDEVDVESLKPKQRWVYNNRIAPVLRSIINRREREDIQRRWDAAG